MSIDVETVHIDKGKHKSPGDGHCLMEVVAMFTGGPFTDRPSCVSHVLRNFGMALNDQWDDARRQDLRRFIPLLPGTAGDGLDEARGYLALDWLVRTFAPTWLDLAGLADHAAELRAAAPITGTGSAAAALPLITAARAAARDAAGHAARDAAGHAAWDAAGHAAWDAARAAAWDAAGDAAKDAAGDAAGDAAWDAAKDAAWDAAWDAAKDAARAAARDAAGDAAWDAARAAARDAAGHAARDAARAAAKDAAKVALQPTVDTLQASALDLYGRMIHPAVTP